MVSRGGGWHALASFGEDVAAQALGTVMGAGLAYVGASALGMIQHEQPRTVALVLALTGGPLLLSLVLRRRLAAHYRHRRSPGGMRETLLRDVGARMAAGEPLTADDMRLIPLLAGAPAAEPPTRTETGS